MAKKYKPYKDIRVSTKYDAQARKAIAQDIIDFMVKRTLSGKDVNNKQFPKYSKEYTKSLDFKNAGKSKSKVNLKLSFEMLNSLHLIKSGIGKIRIGVDKANEGKAEGNELGTYGNSNPLRGKKREFIGISRSDLKSITRKYPVRNKSLLEKIVATKKAVEEVVDEEL